MKIIIKFLSIAALAACTPLTERAPPLPPPEQDQCAAGQYAELVGQDATALERVLILGQVRVIRHGTAVTMDYRPERINFVIDPANTIESIRCG